MTHPYQEVVGFEVLRVRILLVGGNGERRLRRIEEWSRRHKRLYERQSNLQAVEGVRKLLLRNL